MTTAASRSRRTRPRGSARRALLVAVSVSLAAACSKSHRPGDGFDGFDEGDVTGAAGSGASFGAPGGAGRRGGGRAGATGSAGMPDRSPFFNCGGSKVGVCAGNGVGVCFEDGTYQFTPCAPGASCFNSGSGAECICVSGTEGDGFTCDDADECSDGTALCSRPETCVNLLGGYGCGACPQGYDDLSPNGNGSQCVDIDECAAMGGGCDSIAACTNLEGSFRCECPPGYLAFDEHNCAAGLLDLHVWPSELTPPFATEISYYTVNASVLTETVDITATPVAGAAVAIAGEPVDPGVPWTTPWLQPGVGTGFFVEVYGDRGSSYAIDLYREGAPYMLLPTDANGSRALGNRVAVSANVLVVAAPYASSGGVAWVYFADGSDWVEEAVLTGDAVQADGLFGNSLALDGGKIAVGAPGDGSSGPNSGAVYVFERGHSGWTQIAYLTADNAGAGDYFGHSVALYGDRLLVGAPSEDGDADGLQDSGAAYVFEREAGGWVQRAYLKASNADAGDLFGMGLSLSEGRLVVAAPREDGGSPGVNGNADDNSAQDSGAAYVFEEAAGSWTQQAYLKASNPGAGTDPDSDPGDQFGWSESLRGRGVAIFGNTIAVGAATEDSSALGVNGEQNDDSSLDSGAVYVFVRTESSWAQEAYIKAGDPADSDNFGGSIALSQDRLVVGAPLASGGGHGVVGGAGDGTISRSGTVYVYERSGGAWTQRYRLKAATPSQDESFGWTVAAADGVIAVGTGGPVLGSGAAYLFR
jgi:hypothetical protein